jgi:hypothetical protein
MNQPPTVFILVLGLVLPTIVGLKGRRAGDPPRKVAAAIARNMYLMVLYLAFLLPRPGIRGAVFALGSALLLWALAHDVLEWRRQKAKEHR